jgi:hypothetical protein
MRRQLAVALARLVEAELDQWRKLADPVTLHANLLRGIPCTLPRHLLLHLAGDEVQNAVAERDRMKSAICAYVNASNNDDTAGDTWGELLRVVGYESSRRLPRQATRSHMPTELRELAEMLPLHREPLRAAADRIEELALAVQEREAWCTDDARRRMECRQ